MTEFPIARYRLEWTATRPIRLPEYAGSLLRGIFGHALKSVACLTRRTECTGCPVTATCPYPAIFAPRPPERHALQKFSAIPPPWLVEPPPRGARLIEPGAPLAFHLVLTGRALAELPLVILAWRRALARGIGAGNGSAELQAVYHEDEHGAEHPIHGSRHTLEDRVLPHRARITLPPTPPSGEEHLTLVFTTPLRLQENGRPLSVERLTPRALLLALARRANLVAEFHAGAPLITDFALLTQAAAQITDQRQLHWQDWTRYSSRQQQAMTLGGAVGQWRLSGPLAPFRPMLRLGEWLHVGKETVFGLGRYTQHATPVADSSAPPPQTRDRSLQAIDFPATIE